MTPGVGKAAHVHQEGDAVGQQELRELLKGPSRMPNRQDRAPASPRGFFSSHPPANRRGHYAPLSRRPPPPYLKPRYASPGTLLVGEGVLHHLGEVGVSHKLGELPDVPGVGLQEPGAERPPEVVGLYVSLLQAALAHPAVEPSPQGVLRHPLSLLAQE